MKFKLLIPIIIIGLLLGYYLGGSFLGNDPQIDQNSETKFELIRKSFPEGVKSLFITGVVSAYEDHSAYDGPITIVVDDYKINIGGGYMLPEISCGEIFGEIRKGTTVEVFVGVTYLPDDTVYNSICGDDEYYSNYYVRSLKPSQIPLINP